MFDELKEVKYFERNNRFQWSYNKKCFKICGYGTQASICNGAFLWIYLMAYYIHNNSSIIDVWSEAKVEPIIVIVKTHSVSCYDWALFQWLINDFITGVLGESFF